jgi:CubicO group peptidase (beta-lactamase class C family)
VFRHTAGFAYGLIGQTPVDQLYRDNGIDFGRLASLKERVEDKLPKMPLLYHPGERWVYSVSHDVQAYLVELFSGMSFDEFCRERIFAPLGMRDTVFGVPKAYTSRYTAHYQQPPGGGALVRIETRDGRPPEGAPNRPLAYARFTTVPFGGLSLSSSARDYALFGQMLVNGGELAGIRLLSPKTVELMTSNNLPPNFPGICCPPGLSPSGNGYGLGVSVLLDPALNGNLGSKGTFGWPGGASTFAILDPKEQMVLILMTQHAPADGDLAARFQTLAYQAIVK